MPSLRGLARDSNLIVLARVERVVSGPPRPFGLADPRPGVSESKIAEAEILEVWKGTIGERVRFLASPSWECDVSTAVNGETAMLFLRGDSPSSLHSISSSGAGRLPVKDDSVMLHSVLLTREIKSLLGLPAETFRHRVGLALLKQQIQGLVKETRPAP